MFVIQLHTMEYDECQFIYQIQWNMMMPYLVVTMLCDQLMYVYNKQHSTKYYKFSIFIIDGEMRRGL